MKIKLRLTLPGSGSPSGQLVEFELAGKAWTANTGELAEVIGEASAGRGGLDMIRRLADMDPALVDDFRRTL